MESWMLSNSHFSGTQYTRIYPSRNFRKFTATGGRNL